MIYIGVSGKKIVKIIGEQIFTILFMFLNLNLNFRAKIMVLYLAEKYLLFSMDDGHIHNPVRNVVCVISTLEQTWYKIQICILESYEKLEHFGFP